MELRDPNMHINVPFEARFLLFGSEWVSRLPLERVKFELHSPLVRDIIRYLARWPCVFSKLLSVGDQP